MKKKIWIWFIVSLLIGGGLSLLASSHPDGYEKAGEETGFIEKATSYFTSPLPDYALPGNESNFSNSIVGIFGVILTFLVFLVIGKLLGKKQT